MNAKPILMHGHSIRSLMAGHKTQTRRIVKPQPPGDELGNTYSGQIFGPEMYSPVVVDRHGEEYPGPDIYGIYDEDGEWGVKCRYGQPGDLLYVRERHAIVPRTAYAQSMGVEQTLRPGDDHDAAIFQAGWDRSPPGRWRPSIHMPRWASRITLHLTDVRVERVQGISEDDAIDEGVEACFPNTDHEHSARDRFRALWNFTNGAGAWDRNEWCWVLCFDVIQANVDDVIADPSRYAIWEPTS